MGRELGLDSVCEGDGGMSEIMEWKEFIGEVVRYGEQCRLHGGDWKSYDKILAHDAALRRRIAELEAEVKRLEYRDTWTSQGKVVAGDFRIIDEQDGKL
jgi:hypothetical protein